MDKNKVILVSNELKIMLNEDTKKREYIEVEEARNLLVQSIMAYCKRLGMK